MYYLTKLQAVFLTTLLSVTSSKLNAAEEWLYFFPSADNEAQQGFARITNVSSSSGLVTVAGIDDEGVESVGIVTFILDAGQSLQFNSQDLEDGNTSKGLTGNLDDGTGSWRLLFSSDLNLAITGLFRNDTGFVNTIHQTADTTDGLTHFVPFFNPASNTNQASRLRLINTTSSSVDFEITGTDDAGVEGGLVTLSVAANASVELTAGDLENGSSLTTGSFGDGSGKWYLDVVSSDQAKVMSLLEDPGGNLSNLSLPATPDSQGDYVLNYVLPNGADAQSFVRIVNPSSSPATISITGIDDAGNSSSGNISINLGAREAINFRSEFFENGNTGIGLQGALGDGEGNWRLVITSDQDIEVMGLFRTPEGFLNTTHDNSSAAEGTSHVVAFFNPGSNTNQQSVLRLNNLTQTSNTFTIAGVDDEGNSPGSGVERILGASVSLEITAAELESSGLGDGTGKWQLTVTSTGTSSVQSILIAPDNFQSNLSTRLGEQAAKEPISSDADTSDQQIEGLPVLAGKSNYVIGPITAKYYSENDGTESGQGNDGSDSSITQTLIATETVDSVSIQYSFDNFKDIEAKNFYGVWEGQIEVFDFPAQLRANISLSWSDASLYIDDDLVVQTKNSDEVVTVDLPIGVHDFRVELHNHWHTVGFNFSFTDYEELTKDFASLDIDPLLSENTEIVYVGLYESDEFDNSVSVNIPDGEGDIFLIFYSYDAVNWVVENPDNRSIAGVAFNSNGPGSTVSIDSEAPVYLITDFRGNYDSFESVTEQIELMTLRSPDYIFGSYDESEVAIVDTNNRILEVENLGGGRTLKLLDNYLSDIVLTFYAAESDERGQQIAAYFPLTSNALVTRLQWNGVADLNRLISGLPRFTLRIYSGDMLPSEVIFEDVIDVRSSEIAESTLGTLHSFFYIPNENISLPVGNYWVSIVAPSSSMGFMWILNEEAPESFGGAIKLNSDSSWLEYGISPSLIIEGFQN